MLLSRRDMEMHLTAVYPVIIPAPAYGHTREFPYTYLTLLYQMLQIPSAVLWCPRILYREFAPPTILTIAINLWGSALDARLPSSKNYNIVIFRRTIQIPRQPTADAIHLQSQCGLRQ